MPIYALAFYVANVSERVVVGGMVGCVLKAISFVLGVEAEENSREVKRL